MVLGLTAVQPREVAAGPRKSYYSSVYTRIATECLTLRQVARKTTGGVSFTRLSFKASDVRITQQSGAFSNHCCYGKTTMLSLRITDVHKSLSTM